MVNYRDNTVGAGGTGVAYAPGYERKAGLDYEYLAGSAGVNISGRAVANISGRAVAEAADSKVSYDVFKRCTDVTISALALLILALPMLLIALIVKIDSSGSAIFCQNRVGQDGRLFKIYKFRTMRSDAPSEVPTEELVQSYSYITRVGALLRKTSLDELPQLINVFRGDMSFVGPRPLIAGESEIHELRSRAGVYSVRPGITGLAQVSGRDNVSAQEKVHWDTEYVERRSLLMDVYILFRTVAVVITGDGYAEGAQRSEMREHHDNAA